LSFRNGIEKSGRDNFLLRTPQKRRKKIGADMKYNRRKSDRKERIYRKYRYCI
jgi:hypothetical protein